MKNKPTIGSRTPRKLQNMVFSSAFLLFELCYFLFNYYYALRIL